MGYSTPATSSGELAAGTTTVLAAPGVLTGIALHPGSATSSIKVYDNKSAASGTVLFELVAPANTATILEAFNHPINALNGLTVVVAGTAATAHILYQKTY